MPLIDGTRTILYAMDAEGVERYIGMATPSLRDPRDRRSLLGRVVRSHVEVSEACLSSVAVCGAS